MGAPSADRRRGRWHPEDPVNLGNLGPRGDYMELFQFSCCGKTVPADKAPSRFRSDGCRESSISEEGEPPAPGMKPCNLCGASLPEAEWDAHLRSVHNCGEPLPGYAGAVAHNVGEMPQQEPSEVSTPHREETFTKAATPCHEEAVGTLFAQALAVVPVLSDTQARAAEARMHRSWNLPSPVVHGSESEVKSVVWHWAEKMRRAPGFRGFSVQVCLADMGYKGQEAAQLWADLGSTVFVFHLWKTEHAFHTYGPARFVAYG